MMTPGKTICKAQKKMNPSQQDTVKGLLGYQLKKTQHALRLHMDEALKALELTTPQYSVLAQLELENGISNAELARRAFIRAQTMHGIVTNLEHKGLVKRQSTPHHGRILCTTLTAKGRKTVQKAHQLIKEVEEMMTHSFPLEQKKWLAHMLSECLNNLNT